LKITELSIRNFRSIRSLDLLLGTTTVLIGQNNAGKSAILDAVRIALTRRWGQRGTGFTEHDIHRGEASGDPRTLPPVEITLSMGEPEAGNWDADMVAALEDIITLRPDGRNLLRLRVTCGWNVDKESFDPVWEFLDEAGQPLTGKAQRAINLTGFFAYLPLFWLGALRDAADEFTPRTGHWGRLLKSVRIPDELEGEALQALAELDARIAAADPKLAQIAELIGKATHIAIGEGPGAAKLNTLPMSIDDMLQRTGVVLRNEALRPWLPIGHHGQGLQSLSVIFLFQAAVLQQLQEDERPGTEAVFAIEEPETHLHPQAARTLWEHIQTMHGQRLMTTHSPYFVQHVPLRDLRVVRLKNGSTEVAALPPRVSSELPWTPAIDGLVQGPAGRIFLKDPSTGHVAARGWFDEQMADRLADCYRQDADAQARAAAVKELRHRCRILPSAEDEVELGFHGRRVRGEIFFARRWILVEGVTEHLLVHALGKALDWHIDAHGVAVIDFQQSGSAGIYPALAEAFEIPWHMITDGDGESAKFKQQILNRGFTDADLLNHFTTLPAPGDLEDCLLADGHEAMLRDILAETSGQSARTCPLPEFLARLKNKKTGYMSVLAPRVAADPALAARMPAAFVNLINTLRGAAP
jgi:putative ATP-dependent endonuclease of the OLD family